VAPCRYPSVSSYIPAYTEAALTEEEAVRSHISGTQSNDMVVGQVINGGAALLCVYASISVRAACERGILWSTCVPRGRTALLPDKFVAINRPHT